jgi:hypothetical protein
MTLSKHHHPAMGRDSDTMYRLMQHAVVLGLVFITAAALWLL